MGLTLQNPPIHYRVANVRKARICYPDFIFENKGELVIAEVKLKHCVDAWGQLTNLYGPLVYKIFGLPVRLLEITRYFDPNVEMPGKPFISNSLEECLSTPRDNNIKVLIWTGR